MPNDLFQAHAMKTLGIFITSDRYPEYALSLARAASDQGLMVRIHFTGSGVRLVRHNYFDQLTAFAEISVCRESAAIFQVDHQLANERRRALVPSRRMAQIIRTCDRHLFI
jgi:predicted peroxiredoxin